jgi:anti-sigma B factor antagonist
MTFCAQSIRDSFSEAIKNDNTFQHTCQITFFYFFIHTTMATITTTKLANAMVVTVTEKRLDAKIAVSFKDEMATLINAGETTVILDLAHVGFVDSSGLGAIVTSLKLIGRKGDLLVSGVKDDVMTMFTLTRMDRVFQMFPTTEDALNSLQAK